METDYELLRLAMTLWDDLLEDLEIFGYHDAEPYQKSKARFAEMETQIRNALSSRPKTE